MPTQLPSPFVNLDLPTLEHCLKICDYALEIYKGEEVTKIRRQIHEEIKRQRQSLDPAAGMRLTGADGKKYGY